MNERITRLVEHLQGTCKGLDEGCQDLGIDERSLSMEELEQIDNEIFVCDSCGWWYELGEEGSSRDGERVCENCEND